MPRNNEQKIKLLILYDILLRGTDEEHALSTDELIERLNARGIHVENKALLTDIRTLNDWGFEVMSYKRKSYYFYVADRKFDIAELRILIDAVQAANFISEQKTVDFVDKLASLAGEHKAELLKRNIVCYDTNKHTNKYVFYSIDTLETAIEREKQVSFVYFDRMIDGQKVYRKDKTRYIVNPLSLIFTQDRYYLVGYNDKYMNYSGYRIDRMESLRIEETPITPNKKSEKFSIHQYKKETFFMYMGELTQVELEADSIDTLETAIEREKQVSFVYFDRMIDGQKVYRKDKTRYIVNPLSLIFTQDRYYLVGYNDKYMNYSGYRIDRMESLRIEETPITPNKKSEKFSIHQYKKETFFMYMGELTQVELEADSDMSDEVLDKFGDCLNVTEQKSSVFTVSVKLRPSPPFYAWIAMHRGKIRIKSPEAVKEGMRDFLSHTYY